MLKLVTNRVLSAHRRPYRTRDGYLCALVYTDKQWESFLRAVGRKGDWATWRELTAELKNPDAGLRCYDLQARAAHLG